MRTIVRITFGSHLYGTETPASDLDFKSVYVPDGRDILLQRVKGSLSTKRPKAESERNVAGELDEEAYSLQRYLGLVAEICCLRRRPHASAGLLTSGKQSKPTASACSQRSLRPSSAIVASKLTNTGSKVADENIMIPIHPARAMPFAELHAGLLEAKAARLVNERSCGPLRLYCYTQACVYDRQWTPITMLARGLIIDIEQQRIVATPFPKFFNLGEATVSIPGLPFDVFEKLDGSLIIIWHDEATGWRCATKGSFESEQAQVAAGLLTTIDTTSWHPGNTYLAEYVAPDNRIVVPYDRAELALLSIYDPNGYELAYTAVQDQAKGAGVRCAKRIHFNSLADLVMHAQALPATAEGFVLRFTDGIRLKIKGDEYRRIHALISHCTPLAIWASMQASDDLDSLRMQLPEEFWIDFDAIVTCLSASLSKITLAVAAEASRLSAWTDKEVGLHLAQLDPSIRQFIFPYRQRGGNLLIGKTRATLFRAIRPTGNELPGYVPSYGMQQVIEDNE